MCAISLRTSTLLDDDRRYWYVDILAQKQHISLLARDYESAVLLLIKLQYLLKTYTEGEIK
jgi:hypothetical protein